MLNELREDPLRISISARLLLAFSIIIYSIFSFFAERKFDGAWPDINHAFGFLLLLLYVVVFFKSNREVLLTGFYQGVYSVGMLLSAALVSSGMYMFEISEYGNQNGIFWIVLLFFVCGLEINRLGYRVSYSLRMPSLLKKMPVKIDKLIIFGISGISIFLAFYIVAVYRGPMLLGVDRVTFWRSFAPSYLSFFPSLIIQSFFFVAYYFLFMRSQRRSTLVPLAFVVLYFFIGIFVLGQKFSLFILFFAVWLALLPGFFPKFRIEKLHAVVIVFVVVLLSGSVLLNYLSQGRDADFALARIALQSQVLWSVFNDADALVFFSGDWFCYLSCGQYVDGKDFISYRYLPFDTYNFYTDGGTTLSGFMPALPILTMGLFFAVVFHFSISFALGFIQAKLVLACAANNLIYSFLLYKLQVSLALIWFAAITTAIPGFLLTLCLAFLYRVLFSSANRSTSAVFKSQGGGE